MIEKKTEVNRIEIDKTGVMQIRFGLLLVEDGNVIDTKWHRTAVEQGMDVGKQLEEVNKHLVSMNKAPIPQEDMQWVLVQQKTASKYFEKKKIEGAIGLPEIER